MRAYGMYRYTGAVAGSAPKSATKSGLSRRRRDESVQREAMEECGKTQGRVGVDFKPCRASNSEKPGLPA